MTDLAFMPTRALAEKIRAGEISSTDAVNAYLERIQRLNGPINAVVALDETAARERARVADEKRANGEPCGPLHGVPLTLKDTWEVVGMPTTAGAPALAQHRPEKHADIAQKLVDAGAIIIGKTNVPLYASDLQSYNKVYGVTRNPRDLERTPGGSSGGAAAAVAAGLTSFEVGSDVGGSIRTPTHFNGVFGHKPTRDLVSMRGHIPGPPGLVLQPDLVEAGPIARTADDLSFILGIIAGPRTADARAWKLDLTPARLDSLKDLKVAVWFEDPACPIDNPLQQGYQALSDALAREGARVQEARHELLRLEQILPTYFNLLGSLMGTGLTPAQRRQMAWIARLEKWLRLFIQMTLGIGQYGRGVNQRFHEWVVHHETREQMRAQIETLFAEVDVLLTPITPTVAIHHDHSMPIFNRKISVNGEKRSYMDQFCWIGLATLLGLPATTAPVGKDENGLPFGVQIIGAPGMDLTTIRVAQLLEEAGLSGFERPEGF
ncbi:amidase [Mangrovitalea sediminis]|uniref:amidase n=1 Tax=Mangrovitalea sediminis TaxID=1982043 RepID=UPI000BE5D1D9|nr:amidase [Mangrovitalea sediminis]